MQRLPLRESGMGERVGREGTGFSQGCRAHLHMEKMQPGATVEMCHIWRLMMIGLLKVGLGVNTKLKIHKFNLYECIKQFTCF